VVVAAHVLDLSEKTIRTWTGEGLLKSTKEHGRVVLEPERLHEVAHLVRELRAAGKKHDLITAVWARLQDQALLDRPDLQESLDQMRQGRGTVVRSKDIVTQ
jgi:DNA-binding transcriptional MerR regulator